MNLLLDIARGVAALLVFLFHIRDALVGPLPVLAALVAFGSLGVPMFFVISGYVISASAESTLRRSETAGSFLKRRFLRIFPPFWLSIVVVVGLPYLVAALSALKSGAFEMPDPRFVSLTGADWLQLVTLVKVFGTPDGDLQAAFAPVNAVYWTLAIEFQFYLCMYLALLVRRRFHLLIGLVTALSLLLLARPVALDAGWFIHYWPMFAVGIALQYLLADGWGVDRLVRWRPRGVAASAAGGVLAAVLVLAYRGTLGQALLGVFPSVELGFAVICALLLWLAAPSGSALEAHRDRGHVVLRWLLKPAAYLGVISYSVYLLHGKLVQLPAMVVRQLFAPSDALNPLTSVLLTLALCALFHIWAEKPFMSKRQQALNDKVLER